MSTAVIDVELDETFDVLYVHRADARVKISREAPNDCQLIFNLGADGSIVGVQLVEARGLGLTEWLTHPDRDLLPSDIRESLDRWYAAA